MDNTGPSVPDTRSLLIHVVIPLLCVFSVGIIVALLWRRKRRRSRLHYQDWPARRVLAPDGNVMYLPRSGLRRNIWGGMHSREGLNELGEAPPPYDTKKQTTDVELGHVAGVGGASAGAPAPTGTGTGDEQTGQVSSTTTEHRQLRDSENGAMPPEYFPTPPPLAVIAESARR